jgi:hypothetical protein
MFLHLRDIPPRLATGGFILHTGLEKWNGTEEQAKGVHAMAAGAFPFLAKVPPATFLKALSVTEIGVGAALLTPVVPSKVAGAALSAFAGGLVALYLRTPTLHKPGSVWADPGWHRGQQGRLDARDRPWPAGGRCLRPKRLMPTQDEPWQPSAATSSRRTAARPAECRRPRAGCRPRSSPTA